MLAVFFRSIGLHLSWFVRSLIPGKHDAAPLSLRRFTFLLLGYPFFLAFQLLHWFGFLLDELLFPGYRKVQIIEPVFISGIPRSGTTFVHRTLATDSEQFSSVSTWEAALAPSITERKIIRILAAIDRLIGAPIDKAIHRFTAKAAGDFNDVHEVDLSGPEEDYLWLLPAGSCFIMLMAFPFSDCLKRTALLHQMPSDRRDQLLDFYLNCIRRHLYCAPEGRRLLSKNAAFGTWVTSLASRLPDAHFLLCVREPERGLSSQLSSLESARRLFATDSDGRATTATFTEVFTENYSELAKLDDTPAAERIAFLEQEDLRKDPAGILGAALELVAITPGPNLIQHLNSLTPHQESRHKHSAAGFGLKNIQIDVCLKPPYQMILQSERRARLRSS